MNKFSLIIIPEEDSYQEFEKIIQKYSKEYKTPLFVPHLTMISHAYFPGDTVVETVRKIVKQFKPFELQVGNVEISTTYHQCVFARTNTTAGLMNLHLSLKESLNIQEKHVFMPHLSLVYGDLDMTTREKISQEIKLKSTGFTAKKITIIIAGSTDPKDLSVVEEIAF